MVKSFRQLYNNFEDRIGVLRQFRVHTFLVLVVIGIAVIFYLANFIETDAKQRLANAFAVSTRPINNQLTMEDLSAPPTKTLRSRLDKIFQDNLLVGDNEQNQENVQLITRAKVWSEQGKLIYDSEQEYGNGGGENKELKAALNSKISAGYAQDASDKTKNTGKDLVEIYIPITKKESINPVGVLEIYITSGSIRSFTNRTTVATSVIVVLGLIFLYLSLSWLFSRASKKIQDKNRKLKQLTDKVMLSLKEVENAYLENMQALTLAVDAKDHYTAGHSFRVASFAMQIGKELGLSKTVLRNIENGAKCHDIGKVGIKDSILNKKGSLTKDEYKEIKKHAQIGANILGSVEFLHEIVPIIRWHHERLDGSGYPDGLKNINIPVEARIVAVADVFDAMTSDRPNRKALSTEEAVKELNQGSGILYDQEVVAALLRAFGGSSCILCNDECGEGQRCLVERDVGVEQTNLLSSNKEEIWADSGLVQNKRRLNLELEDKKIENSKNKAKIGSKDQTSSLDKNGKSNKGNTKQSCPPDSEKNCKNDKDKKISRFKNKFKKSA